MEIQGYHPTAALRYIFYVLNDQCSCSPNPLGSSRTLPDIALHLMRATDTYHFSNNARLILFVMYIYINVHVDFYKLTPVALKECLPYSYLGHTAKHTRHGPEGPPSQAFSSYMLLLIPTVSCCNNNNQAYLSTDHFPQATSLHRKELCNVFLSKVARCGFNSDQSL